MQSEERGDLIRLFLEEARMKIREESEKGIREEVWEPAPKAVRAEAQEEALRALREKVREVARKEAREGIRKAREQLLLSQLRHRFGKLPEAVVNRVEAGSAADVERWALRVLDASTLDAVFTQPN